MKTIKAKVHMLPTENEGVIISDVGPYDTDMIPTSEVPKELRSHDRPHNHLYFTTDEEIKEGDWVIQQFEGQDADVCQITNGEYEIAPDIQRKIIATTDPKLNSTQVEPYDTSKPYAIEFAQIPQSFIEEYCKVGGIDEVLIEYTSDEFSESTKLLMEAYGDNPDDFTKESELKLNPDNTIIIHPVEEKMYTLKQIKHMFDIGRDSAFQEMHFDEAIKYRDNELNKMD